MAYDDAKGFGDLQSRISRTSQHRCQRCHRLALRIQNWHAQPRKQSSILSQVASRQFLNPSLGSPFLQTAKAKNPWDSASLRCAPGEACAAQVAAFSLFMLDLSKKLFLPVPNMQSIGRRGPKMLRRGDKEPWPVDDALFKTAHCLLNFWMELALVVARHTAFLVLLLGPGRPQLLGGCLEL